MQSALPKNRGKRFPQMQLCEKTINHSLMLMRDVRKKRVNSWVSADTNRLVL